MLKNRPIRPILVLYSPTERVKFKILKNAQKPLWGLTPTIPRPSGGTFIRDLLGGLNRAVLVVCQATKHPFYEGSFWYQFLLFCYTCTLNCLLLSTILLLRHDSNSLFSCMPPSLSMYLA